MKKIPSQLNLQPGEELRLWKDISEKPDRRSRYRKLARLLRKRKRFREANYVLRMVLKRIPDDQWREKRDTWKKIARNQEDAGLTTQAIRTYRRLIRNHPDHFVPYERLERIYKEQNRLEEMVKVLRRVGPDNPQRERALKHLFRIAKKLEKYRSALKYLKSLIDEFGPDRRYYKEMGRMAEKSGSRLRAIGYYQQALELDPENADLELMIGVCQRKEGKRKSARETFENTLSYRPGWYGSHINLAEMDIEDGNFNEAEKHFKKIDSRFPKNSRVMINRASILIREGELEKALELCREGAAETPFYYTDELSLGHAVLAEIHQKLGEEEEAAYHSLMAEKIGGGGDFFQLTIETIDELIEKGDLDMAERVADGLLEKFPMNSLAQVKKAEIARIRGDIDSAIDFAEKASRESNPRYYRDKLRGLELMSRLLREKGDVQGAEKREAEAEEIAAQL